MTPEQETKARQLLDRLYDKMDKNDGELHPHERGMFETLGWLLDGMVAPEID